MKKHLIKSLLLGMICTAALTSCEKEKEIRIPVPTTDTSESKLHYASAEFYGKVRTVTTTDYFSTWDEENEKIIPSELITGMEILEYDNKGILIKSEEYEPRIKPENADSFSIINCITNCAIYEYDPQKLRLTAQYQKKYHYSNFIDNSINNISGYKTTYEYDDENKKATLYVYYTQDENVSPYEPESKLIYNLRPDGHLGNLEAQYSLKRAQSALDDDFEDEAYWKREEIVLARDVNGNWTESYSIITYYSGASQIVYGGEYKKRIFTYF